MLSGFLAKASIRINRPSNAESDDDIDVIDSICEEELQQQQLICGHFACISAKNACICPESCAWGVHLDLQSSYVTIGWTLKFNPSFAVRITQKTSLCSTNLSLEIPSGRAK